MRAAPSELISSSSGWPSRRTSWRSPPPACRIATCRSRKPGRPLFGISRRSSSLRCSASWPGGDSGAARGWREPWRLNATLEQESSESAEAGQCQQTKLQRSRPWPLSERPKGRNGRKRAAAGSRGQYHHLPDMPNDVSSGSGTQAAGAGFPQRWRPARACDARPADGSRKAASAAMTHTPEAHFNLIAPRNFGRLHRGASRPY